MKLGLTTWSACSQTRNIMPRHTPPSSRHEGCPCHGNRPTSRRQRPDDKAARRVLQCTPIATLRACHGPPLAALAVVAVPTCGQTVICYPTTPSMRSVWPGWLSCICTLPRRMQMSTCRRLRRLGCARPEVEAIHTGTAPDPRMYEPCLRVMPALRTESRRRAPDPRLDAVAAHISTAPHAHSRNLLHVECRRYCVLMGPHLDSAAAHTGTAPHPRRRCMRPIERNGCCGLMDPRLDSVAAHTSTAPYPNARCLLQHKWRHCCVLMGPHLDSAAAHTSTAPHPCGRCMRPIERNGCCGLMDPHLDLVAAHTGTALHPHGRWMLRFQWLCCLCVRWRCVIEQINRSTDQQINIINRSTSSTVRSQAASHVATRVQGEYIAWLARLAVACMVAQPGCDSREGRPHGWRDRVVVVLWRWSCVAVCMVVIAAVRGVWWHRWR